MSPPAGVVFAMSRPGWICMRTHTDEASAMARPNQVSADTRRSRANRISCSSGATAPASSGGVTRSTRGSVSTAPPSWHFGRAGAGRLRAKLVEHAVEGDGLAVGDPGTAVAFGARPHQDLAFTDLEGDLDHRGLTPLASNSAHKPPPI